MSIAAGTKLGRYEIRSKIGEGGMGEVYLALDSELDRTVAIKILPEALASDKQRLQRFIQEAKAASALNHPHILTIYEIGSIGNSRFIATEFIDGETLRERMKTGLKLHDALEFSIQIAGALAAAHAAGIIHRDIKPENIMVRRDGYVKVLDFGLAKLTEPRRSATDPEAPTRAMVDTGAGTVMGTANYMSPEQAKGTHVDARTDVWSLGAVLYEMIALHVPFPGETPTETISLILQKDAAPLTRFAPDVPAELERILKKALTKDREERYQTAKDLLIDLRNLKRKLEVDAEIERTMAPEIRAATSTVSGQSATATASGALPTTTPAGPARSASSAEYIVSGIAHHKIVAAVVVVAVIAGAIGIGWYFHARNTEVAIDSIAVLPFANQNGNPNDDWLADGVTEGIINSLTQLPNLKVIARSSVFRYKGKGADPLAAGKELGVRAVLTGRIMQRGDNLTVSAELMDVRDNKQLWGEQYERKTSDLLAVQRQIAQEITSNLRLTLSALEQNRLNKRLTDNPEAYRLYLEGRYYWNKRTEDGLQKGIEYFREAIDKDRNYALAYSGLADCYLLLSEHGAMPATEAMSQARSALQTALQLDPTLAEAHASRGLLEEIYERDWPEAEKEFQRAIELNPSYSTTYQWYGIALVVRGRSDEGLNQIKRALDVDPVSSIAYTNVAWAHYLARKFDPAMQYYRRNLELDPNYASAHRGLGWILLQRRDFPAAIGELQTAFRLDDSDYNLSS
ncbi:MAG TPA: protein kinase, partial [Pyrinomonadaceae bacterium]